MERIFYEADVTLKKEIWDNSKKVKKGTKFVDGKCFDGKYQPDTAEVNRTEKQLKSDKKALKEEADRKKEEAKKKKKEEKERLKKEENSGPSSNNDNVPL